MICPKCGNTLLETTDGLEVACLCGFTARKTTLESAAGKGPRVKKVKAHPHEDFMRAIIDLAHACGWRVAGFRPAQTAKGWRTPIVGDAGWPDLVLVGHGRLLVRELKVPPDKPSEEQEAWLTALETAGVNIDVWTPKEWGLIEATLKEGR